MNSTSVKKGLGNVYWGMILTVLGDLIGTDALAGEVALSAVDFVAAILSLLGLLLILRGLRAAGEVSGKYRTARGYVISDMLWQIVSVVLVGIGLSYTPLIDGILSILLDILAIRAILSGNEEICRLVGENPLAAKAKKIKTLYTGSAAFGIIGAVVFAISGLGGLAATLMEEATFAAGFFAAAGIAGIVCLICLVVYLCAYILVLGNIRKTAKTV